MSTRISCYILTLNRAKQLRKVLEPLRAIADEIVVVDSGSTDGTQAIAAESGATVIHRTFDDFTTQRAFAVSQCRHDWILAVDSDELMSPELAARLTAIKERLDIDGPDAYAVRREWYVLGRKVHCFYPSRCPDFPIRLFRKDGAGYLAGRHVHETIRGFRQAGLLDEPLLHHTCETVEELYGKIGLYTTLAAQDLRAAKGRPAMALVFLMPAVTALKWYLVEGGWRDGWLGLVLARYVSDTVYQKYLKARFDD